MLHNQIIKVTAVLRCSWKTWNSGLKIFPEKHEMVNKKTSEMCGCLQKKYVFFFKIQF